MAVRLGPRLPPPGEARAPAGACAACDRGPSKDRKAVRTVGAIAAVSPNASGTPAAPFAAAAALAAAVDASSAAVWGLGWGGK